MKKRIKLLRVVTQAEVVPWHLDNFITRCLDDYDLYITGNKVSVYKDTYPQVTFIDNEIHRKISLFNDIKALIYLMYTCIKIRPNITHSIMPKSGFVTALAGFLTFVPIRIHTFTGLIWSNKTGLGRSFLKIMDKVILRLNTKCLTDSPSQSNFLFENGFVKHGKPIEYLGKGSLTGVNMPVYDLNFVKDRAILRSKYGIKAEDFVFGFFARKSITKGVVAIFECFEKVAKLPNVKMLMIGHNETDGLFETLMEKYQHLSNQIVSLESVKNHEQHLAICDVLCAPSISEGFGSTVIEAAAFGIPTIGFKVLGLVDSVDDQKTGLLIPYGDIDGFANAMKKFYDNLELRDQMGYTARKRVETFFTSDYMYTLQHKFYQSLLNSAKN